MLEAERADFNEVFHRKITPRLAVLDRLRRDAVKFILIAGVFLLLTVVSVVFLADIFGPGFFVVGLVFGLLTAYFGYQGYQKWKDYRAKYKQAVVRPLLESIDESIRYSPNRSFPKNDYHYSELFLQGVDRYQGDDYFEGRIGETDFHCSELHTQYKTETTDSKGNRQTRWHTIFKGLFMSADFHKHISSETFVLPDQAEKMFGNFIGKFFQSKNFSRDELVKMEDPEFERHFVVYSDSQVDARYILSPGMMKRITDLRTKWRSRVHLSFKGTRVFIAISMSGGLLEPSFKKINKEHVRSAYQLIVSMIAVIDDLNLNTRIWTKS